MLFFKKLRTQFLAGYLVAALFALTVCGLVIYLVDQTLANIDELNTVNEREQLSSQIQVMAYQKSSYARGYLLYGTENYYKQWENSIQKTNDALEQLLRITRREENRVLVQQMMEANRRYDQFVQNQVMSPARAGNREAAFKAAETQGKDLADAMFQSVENYRNKRGNEMAQLRERIITGVRPARALALILTLIGLIVGAAVSLWLANQIARAARSLVTAATNAAAGDLTRIVAVKRADEIGELTAAFNRMVEQLRVLVGKVADTASALAAQSQELAASTQQVTAVTQNMEATTAQLSSGAQEAAASSEEMASASSGVENEATEGVKAVELTVARIAEAARIAHQSGELMQILGMRSAQIGEITKTITVIADQTNLLALNAAIEAARAGEHGRGFAVVAEEVRKLAENSVKAVREIDELVRTIQQDTGRAVLSVEKSARAVQNEVDSVQTTGNRLRQILEQTRGVLRSTREVADTIERFSKSSQQLNNAARDISSTMQQVSQMAQDLARQAENLDSAVKVFKLA